MQHVLGGFGKKFEGGSGRQIQIDQEGNFAHAAKLGGLFEEEGAMVFDAAEIAVDFLLTVVIGPKGSQPLFNQLEGSPARTIHGPATPGSQHLPQCRCFNFQFLNLDPLTGNTELLSGGEQPEAEP